MGRRSQPAAVKEAKGNPGRRPIAKEGPASQPSAMVCPKDLKGGPRRAWDKIAPDLAGMRILKPSDLSAFRRYCVFLDKWNQTEQQLKTEEIVYTTVTEHNPEGLQRRSQVLMVALMLDKRLSEIEDRFGMNPAARQRLLLQMSQQSALPLERASADKRSPDPMPASPSLPAPQSPVGLLN